MKIKWEEILKKNNPTTHLLFNIRILVYKLTTIQTNWLQLTQGSEVRRQSNHFINISRILRFLILVFVFDRELLNHLAGR